MALPTQNRLFHKYYTCYVTDVTAANSPAVAVSGRGRVIDIRYVPVVATATAPLTVTPQVNATPMQLNGANTSFSVASGAAVNAVAGSVQPNGLNIVDRGDVIVLAHGGGATGGQGYYTITVDERSL